MKDGVDAICKLYITVKIMIIFQFFVVFQKMKLMLGQISQLQPFRRSLIAAMQDPMNFTKSAINGIYIK